MTMLVKMAYQLAKLYWFIVRPVTLGVRVLMISNGKVLLVRHTYRQAWFLPGGGVKRGETVEAAVRREAAEECGARLGTLQFLGLYTDFVDFKSDHITLFFTSEFELQPTLNREIARVAFFPLDQLPSEMNPGSRRRIEAYITENLEPCGLW
jgi:8-oxo-dGTP pyrophosphatase MutT (NUDIX family)